MFVCIFFFYSGEGFFILYKENEENREIRNVRLIGNTDDSFSSILLGCVHYLRYCYHSIFVLLYLMNDKDSVFVNALLLLSELCDPKVIYRENTKKLFFIWKYRYGEQKKTRRIFNENSLGSLQMRKKRDRKICLETFRDRMDKSND